MIIKIKYYTYGERSCHTTLFLLYILNPAFAANMFWPDTKSSNTSWNCTNYGSMQHKLRDGWKLKWLFRIERGNNLSLDKAYPGLYQTCAPLAMTLNGCQICNLQSMMLERHT